MAEGRGVSSAREQPDRVAARVASRHSRWYRCSAARPPCTWCILLRKASAAWPLLWLLVASTVAPVIVTYTNGHCCYCYLFALLRFVPPVRAALLAVTVAALGILGTFYVGWAISSMAKELRRQQHGEEGNKQQQQRKEQQQEQAKQVGDFGILPGTASLGPLLRGQAGHGVFLGPVQRCCFCLAKMPTEPCLMTVLSASSSLSCLQAPTVSVAHTAAAPTRHTAGQQTGQQQQQSAGPVAQQGAGPQQAGGTGGTARGRRGWSWWIGRGWLWGRSPWTQQPRDADGPVGEGAAGPAASG